MAFRPDRRRFLGATILAAAAIPSTGNSGTVHAAESRTFTEPARNLPVHEDADVIVCGGGPAGVAAALAAARAGAKTRLIELQGSLGGVWTSGLLTFIFDFDKDGLAREIKKRLHERNAIRFDSRRDFVYEPEEMKWVLEKLCLEAGINIQLQTQVAAAYKEGRRVRTIVTESKSGREAWRAPVFIDTTGDGDLCAQAGCGFDFGREENGLGQPLTLNALAVVKDVDQLKDFVSFYQDGWKSHVPATVKNLEEMKRAGIEPSYGMPTIFHVYGNLVLLMFNHEYKTRPDDAQAMTDATIRARNEIHEIVRKLNALGGPWEGLRLATTAEQIGIRDGRRIHGRYVVTKEDLANGARFDDAVCLVEFGVDIHATDRDSNRKQTIERGGIRSKPYEIPMRALIPKDIDGVLTAGRCISGDFVAHASYRVTGNAVAMGEAAGIVAAEAAKSGKLPHEIPWKRRST